MQYRENIPKILETDNYFPKPFFFFKQFSLPKSNKNYIFINLFLKMEQILLGPKKSKPNQIIKNK